MNPLVAASPEHYSSHSSFLSEDPLALHSDTYPAALERHCTAMKVRPAALEKHWTAMKVRPAALKGHYTATDVYPPAWVEHWTALADHLAALKGHCTAPNVHPVALEGHWAALEVRLTALQEHWTALDHLAALEERWKHEKILVRMRRTQVVDLQDQKAAWAYLMVAEIPESFVEAADSHWMTTLKVAQKVLGGPFGVGHAVGHAKTFEKKTGGNRLRDRS